MISTTDAARLLGMSTRRVRALCEQKRIAGARQLSGVWLLPNRPKITPIVAQGRRGPALRSQIKVGDVVSVAVRGFRKRAKVAKVTEHKL